MASENLKSEYKQKYSNSNTHLEWKVLFGMGVQWLSA